MSNAALRVLLDAIEEIMGVNGTKAASQLKGGMLNAGVG